MLGIIVKSALYPSDRHLYAVAADGLLTNHLKTYILIVRHYNFIILRFLKYLIQAKCFLFFRYSSLY